jgi:hypothetical protein
VCLHDGSRRKPRRMRIPDHDDGSLNPNPLGFEGPHQLESREEKGLRHGQTPPDIWAPERNFPFDPDGIPRSVPEQPDPGPRTHREGPGEVQDLQAGAVGFSTHPCRDTHGWAGADFDRHQVLVEAEARHRCREGIVEVPGVPIRVQIGPLEEASVHHEVPSDLGDAPGHDEVSKGIHRSGFGREEPLGQGGVPGPVEDQVSFQDVPALGAIAQEEGPVAKVGTKMIEGRCSSEELHVGRGHHGAFRIDGDQSVSTVQGNGKDPPAPSAVRGGRKDAVKPALESQNFGVDCFPA